MTRKEWTESMTKEEAVFRIARGCDGCGFCLPDEKTGLPVCYDDEHEACCRKEHAAWLADQMDI